MDPLKNLLFAGLGALAYSQEKLGAAIHGLVEKGELTREQGEKVLAEWVEKGKSEQERLGDRVSSEMNKLLQRMQLVTREEFEALQTRVEKLEGQDAG